MDFEVILERNNSVIHHFYDGEYSPYDDLEEEPSQICGEILIDNKSIGSIWISKHARKHPNVCKGNRFNS